MTLTLPLPEGFYIQGDWQLDVTAPGHDQTFTLSSAQTYPEPVGEAYARQFVADARTRPLAWAP
ncbi:hypothetical protein [Deinococcus multiflagellatus]|uniref:hypothetical protein n=1 Tax=Deinococcus multiflagellatus TaxID=1656887 RepID=UPI001CC9F88B|nr:hypothetical protein [Deinococcus multiflagellatus]MBZ9715782.1 hypothetical protein [Deinococcus multiflagellatus]